MRLIRWFSLLASLAYGTDCFAVGEKLLDAIMRSDFIFDRTVSNVPFFPLGFLDYSNQNSLEVADGCETASGCEFRYQNVSQALALPVWVGQKHMFLLGETLEMDRFTRGNETITVNSGGLLGAWAMQPNKQWQVGAFLYGYRNIGNDKYSNLSSGTYSGAVARYRHSPHFHSYLGLVRFNNARQTLLFPYLGFDWYLDTRWSISAIMPWPTLNYAPSTSTLIRFGALYSSSNWASGDDANVDMVSFGQWDFGLSYEQKLYKTWWGALTVGQSGFGKLVLESDGSPDFESDIDSSPFVKLSINFRPE